MSDSNQKNPGQKKSDQKKSGKARFAAPLIPGGVVAALLIASLAGYEMPTYSANISELALASTTDTNDTSAVTLPELTEQPDESAISSGDTIESISTVDESNAIYKDGTYTGTGTGWGGTITVQVVIKDSLIASVTILSAPDETPEYFTKAKSITSAIVKAQSTNVDTVSGATYSSNGIIEAVRNALAKASGSSSSSSSSSGKSGSSGSSSKSSTSSKTKAKALATVDESDAQYADGTWTGTGEGWGGDITVSVTIEGGVITAIEITSAENETAAYLKKAQAVIDYILSAQTADVDTVSGATYSSQGIIDAVQAALDEAEAAKAASSDTNTGSDDTDTDSDNSGDSDSAGSDCTEDTETGDSTGSESTDTGTDTDTDTDIDADTDTDTDTGDSDGDGTTGGESESDGTTVTLTMLDGTYTVSGTVYPDEWLDFDEYPFTMKVTIENDLITSITNITPTTNSTNKVYMTLAANGNVRYTGVVTQIVASGTTDDIDVVSGATCSSNALIEAANQAIKEATAAKASE